MGDTVYVSLGHIVDQRMGVTIQARTLTETFRTFRANLDRPDAGSRVVHVPCPHCEGLRLRVRSRASARKVRVGFVLGGVFGMALGLGLMAGEKSLRFGVDWLSLVWIVLGLGSIASGIMLVGLARGDATLRIESENSPHRIL